LPRLTYAIGAAAAAAALALTTLATAGTAVAMPAAAAAQPATTSVNYYLSLGDSLSVGDQPNAKGVTLPTNQGYADQLYNTLRRSDSGLRLYKLGCPGETSNTFNIGGICGYTGDVRTSLTTRKSDQMQAAIDFLHAHRGHVSLITLDIGANDLNNCLTLTSIPAIAECLTPVFASMQTHLAYTLKKLRTAAPGVTIVGMNYYDPELVTWLEGTTAAKTFAADSVELAGIFTEDLDGVYASFKVPVADVFDNFDTTDMTHTMTLPGIGTVPRDVGYICRRTYECAPAPVGPNEHCNPVGYGAISTAFQATLKKIGWRG
jgi:lysophospholipase L1-like esterase